MTPQKDIHLAPMFAQRSIDPRSNIKKFVKDYMWREDANEPLAEHPAQFQLFDEQANHFRMQKWYEVNELLNQRLDHNGVGFDSHNLSLTKDQQLAYANDTQHLFDRGHTIRQWVLSFDTQYLQAQGLLKKDLHGPVYNGDLRYQVDQRRLRTAVQDGMQAFFSQTMMKKPEFVGALQTDTSNVHVHLAIFDHGAKIQNDRGLITPTQRNILEEAIDRSIQLQPVYANQTRAMHNLSKQVQGRSLARERLLELQLQKSAFFADQTTLNQYIEGLAAYDQKSLEGQNQDKLKGEILADLHDHQLQTQQVQPINQYRRHQRRMRYAMVRASALRHDLHDYWDVQAQGQVNDQSDPVYDAMYHEYVRQLKIVTKYRAYNRPLLQSVYQKKAPELGQKQQDLIAERSQLLKDINQTPLASDHITALLKDPEFILRMRSQIGAQEWTQSPDFKDLSAASDDGDHVLSPLTVKHVLNVTPERDQKTMEMDLTKNQHIDLQTLTPAQRLRMAEYEQELLEYEFNCVSYGGLSVHNLRNLRKTPLSYPDQPSSVYERPRDLEDPEIIGTDFERITDDGDLKPGIDRVMRQRVLQRLQRLSAAQDYLDRTHQKSPRWLKAGIENALHQTAVLNHDNHQHVLATQATEQVGHELPPEALKPLVQKHLQSVDDLAR